MSRPVIIANCSGFYGDRVSAAREMVEGGPIDVLTGDWLAELTMLILARSARKDPSLGYAQTFVRQMEEVLGTCVERGIRIVSNAGGLNPKGCAEAVARIAERLGVRPRIAYVSGDDLLGRLSSSPQAEPLDLMTMKGSPDIDLDRVVSANAYLGCWGVAEALRADASVVITGRTADAALVCGPAAWWHDWERGDWDALAGGVVAGHVIECGTHATGGNYSFFTEIPNMRHVGFPIAEIDADGSSVITKHPGTGGAVNIGTVTSQLLYEIQSERYLGPDVTSRFDTVELKQIDEDRVLIHGTKGEPPTGKLKVSVNMLGGFRNDLSVAICGLDVEEKAALVETAFWDACPHARDEYAEVFSQLVRLDQPDAASNEQATAVWRLTLKDPDKQKVGRPAANAAVELALATIPGFFLLSGPPGGAKEFGVHASALVALEAVPQTVVFLDGEQRDVDLSLPSRSSAEPEIPVSDEPEIPVSEVANGGRHGDLGATIRAAVGRIVGARSGDKGGDANLGVFVRSDTAWHWLDSFLTTEQLKQLLPETSGLEVERYRFPRLWALNFVIHGLLGEGVAASTRQDAQAKSLGEWLRAREVEVPVALLQGEHAGWEMTA